MLIAVSLPVYVISCQFVNLLLPDSLCYSLSVCQLCYFMSASSGLPLPLRTAALPPPPFTLLTAIHDASSPAYRLILALQVLFSLFNHDCYVRATGSKRVRFDVPNDNNKT
jgi:hypothetical protein